MYAPHPPTQLSADSSHSGGGGVAVKLPCCKKWLPAAVCNFPAPEKGIFMQKFSEKR